MSLASNIKSNPALKQLAHRLMIPKNEHRPRLWIRWLVNPFFHKRGQGSIIRSRTRLDVFPYNQFTVGTKSVIEDFSTINNGVGDVIIGNQTIIGIGNVIIGPVTIGNEVMLAQNIVVSGLNHGYEDVDTSPRSQKETCSQITISDDVWIGANSVITAGVTLGKHCIIGAGSIVTKDIPPFSVAVGNPAKVIKKYDPSSGQWEKVDVMGNIIRKYD
jgi:acetyltransferase-like isoleucine patch superfamily enzyme